MKKLQKHKWIDTCPKGSILVLVLTVISSMAVLSLGLTYRTYTEIKLTKAYAERTQAYYLASGGIERLILLLSEQLTDESPDFSKIARICPFSETAKNERLFETLDVQMPKQYQLYYTLQDELAHLNINKSYPACWTKLETISKELCAAILDWLDSDSDTNPGGAESDFYQTQKPPSIAKNSEYVTLKELLYVKGVTPNIYLGEDLNRNSVLDDNERDGSLSPPFDNGDNNLNLGLLDIFTVYGNGKININTVTQKILAALPGLDDDTANSILTYRAGFDGQSGTEDDIYFETVEDLPKIPGLSELQIELLEQYCCFDSQYFRAYSYVRLKNSVDCLLMATVKLADKEVKVLYIDRLL